MARVTERAKSARDNYLGFPCVGNALDVWIQSKDGKSFVLTIGTVQVAVLTPADPKSIVLVREREDTGRGNMDVTITFQGSASWIDANNLNAIQLKHPGNTGTLSIQNASPPKRIYGKRIDIPRTQTITSTPRADRIPICNATTAAAVLAAAPSHADFSLVEVLRGIHLPSQDQVDSIRADIASLNTAIDAGEFSTAATTCGRLGLPFPEDDRGHIDFNLFSEAQWHTAYAVGAVTLTYDRRSENANYTYDPNVRALIGMHGTGHYVALVNDMAERGVAGLTAPPALEQIHAYYENVYVESSHQPPEAVRAALLDACQRVMAGMQVHYRLAGNQDPNWGAATTRPIVTYAHHRLVETRGQAMIFESVEAARDYVPNDPTHVPAADGQNARVNVPANFPVVCTLNSPEGYQDSVSRSVWGRRYESDCEGMASFRLRTLPRDFFPLAAVSGRLVRGGIGHSVALCTTWYETDEGRKFEFFFSSNGRPLARISGAHGIGAAVEDEFLAVYARARHNPADFNFGFGVAPEPTTPTAASRESIADELMLKASLDDSLHLAARTNRERQRDDLDWLNIIPPWIRR